MRGVRGGPGLGGEGLCLPWMKGWHVASPRWALPHSAPLRIPLQKNEERAKAREKQQRELARQSAIVEEGLNEARKKALPPQQPSTSSDSPVAARQESPSQPSSSTQQDTNPPTTMPATTKPPTDADAASVTTAGVAAIAAGVIADAQKTARLEGFVNEMVSGSKQAMAAIKKAKP